MKTIGLLAGMTWLSSQEYCRLINEMVKKQLGKLNSAKIAMYSVDFKEIINLEQQGKKQELLELMTDAVKRIENAGADFLVICANTVHKFADEIVENLSIPLLHIADATAEIIKAKQLKKVGLLGTKFTMEKEFYKSILTEKYGLEVIVPAEKERAIIDYVISNELALGEIKASSKGQYLTIIQRLIEEGAEGVILGCTYIPLLIGQEDVNVPTFDTMMIHVKAAVDWALAE